MSPPRSSNRSVVTGAAYRYSSRLLACAIMLGAAALAHPAAASSPPDHVSQPVGPPPATKAWGQRLEADTVYRIEPSPAAGFHWPYFIAIPDAVAPGAPLLVQPNNDGRPGAPMETHLYWASIISEQMIVDFGRALGMIALTPAFPRPAVAGPDDNLYVHALTRAAMQADDPALERPDLQLIAMIDDARRRLAALDHDIPADAVFWGFSAAGDFVTRFAVLHPEKVRAVVAGGLGGLPILPVSRYEQDTLTYPLGVGDIEAISGRPFQADGLRETPMLLFHGAHDGNNSVPEGKELRDRAQFGSDSYSYEQAQWVNQTLGRLPVDRIGPVRLVFEAFGMRDFSYRLVPGAEHVTEPFEDQVREFIACVLGGGPICARR